MDFPIHSCQGKTQSRACSSVMKECCPPTKYIDIDILFKVKLAFFATWQDLLKTRPHSVIQWVSTEAGAAFHSKASPPEAGSLGLRIKPEKVVVACQLLVSPVDRAWPRGLASALVLELAQNPTHDWLFSHKANSQIRRLTKTPLSIVGPSVRRMHFCPPPQACLPHAELTPSNAGIVTHYVYRHDKSDCL